MQMQALEDLMLRASPYAHNYIHLCLWGKSLLDLVSLEENLKDSV